MRQTSLRKRVLTKHFCHQRGTFISGPDLKRQNTTPANIFLGVEKAENIDKILYKDFQRK